MTYETRRAGMMCKNCNRNVPPSGRSTGMCCNHCARSNGNAHTFWCNKRTKGRFFVAPFAAEWAVIIEADDGSLAVVGSFPSELAATLWGNDHETEDSGYICHVRPLESPDD